MARPRTVPENWDVRAREIGVRLQQARHELGLSQEDVAYRVGISAYTYQKFEKGESRPGTPLNPRLTTLIMLSEVLKVEVETLLRVSAQGQ
ncbi:MAG: helix-turn-helix transcriptional regulator [Tetrasphaera sp.]